MKTAVCGCGKVGALTLRYSEPDPTTCIDGKCAQVLFHPAVSVWTVSILPNGDIVSGSSDKTVRVFSASEDRWAAAEEIEAYEDAVAPQPSPNAVQTMEALNKPGAYVWYPVARTLSLMIRFQADRTAKLCRC